MILSSFIWDDDRHVLTHTYSKRGVRYPNSSCVGFKVLYQGVHRDIQQSRRFFLEKVAIFYQFVPQLFYIYPSYFTSLWGSNPFLFCRIRKETRRTIGMFWTRLLSSSGIYILQALSIGWKNVSIGKERKSCGVCVCVYVRCLLYLGVIVFHIDSCNVTTS